ncbi:uncharacterized protein LOC111055767 isoform X2 [Nilaparvata lugens]|nr:uncharacterized protein LOC111055767 isoform X2 [Nilaparvata lugens]
MEFLNDDAIVRLLEDSDADLSDGDYVDIEIGLDDEFELEPFDEEVEIPPAAASKTSTEEGTDLTSSKTENLPHPPEAREKKWKNKRMEQRDLPIDENLEANYEDEKGPLTGSIFRISSY